MKLSPLPFFYKINNRVVGMKLSRVKWIAVIVSVLWFLCSVAAEKQPPRIHSFDYSGNYKPAHPVMQQTLHEFIANVT
ncbi:MAG: hypothetical protein IKD22_02520, partial [Lentisphaeria bacterium]|nr:hypothetical protein [Lentisphaeria bacterium]